MASWVALNDYEGRMLCERTGWSLGAVACGAPRRRRHAGRGEGCDVWIDGERTHVPGVKAIEVLDPTGCGDAFRAALLYGLERGWPLDRCAALGNRIGAREDRHRGGQNHRLDRQALGIDG
jgi:adenosine kinase